MENRNVFSRKSEISVLVHTESYLGNESVFRFFENANKLDGINIFLMPAINIDVQGLDVGWYSHIKKQNITLTVINFPQCSEVIKIHNNSNNIEVTDDEYNKMTELSIVHGECTSAVFDYIITETAVRDPLDCKVPVVSFNECKEILRLRMICCDDYHVSEHFKIDETFYYIYRHKCIFPELQQFWNGCIERQDLNWAEALDNRLNLIARCLDQCKISAYKKIGNNTIMEIKYHVSYLFLLITGTFDNLAWIINDFYQLKLDEEAGSHFNIDLKKRKFQFALQDKTPVVYSVVSNSLFQNRLDAVRELRDRIVHRNFLQAYRGGKANNNNETSYFEADFVFYEKLMKAGFSDSNIAIRVGNDYLIYMIPFIKFIEDLTTEMVNELLKAITKEVFEKEEKVTVWELYEFPCEPYVL